MMHHLITLALIMSTVFLDEIKCQISNSTKMMETTLVPFQVSTPGTAATSNSTEPGVLCSAPEPFPNGWINATQDLPLGMSKVGRAISYLCNTNMKQIGASTAICETSGRWSNNPPQCLSSCTVPLVDHGITRNVSSGSIISHGEKVILECRQSYRPAHGLSTYICNNGTLNVTPRCDPAPKGNCDTPEIPNGTFVQTNGRNVTRNQTYDDGTEIIYRCQNPEHQLINNSVAESNSRRICDAATRNWTGTPPKCVATCGSLHLEFNVTYDGTVLVGERYLIGTKAIVHCRKLEEHVIHPSTAAKINILVCQSNGTWQGNAPTCYPRLEHLFLTQIAIAVACLVSILIFFMALVFLYRTRSSRRQPAVNENSYVRSHCTDAQRMRAELLRQIRRKSFYSLEDPPAGEREYATIHRVGQSRRQTRLSVQYGKLG